MREDREMGTGRYDRKTNGQTNIQTGRETGWQVCMHVKQADNPSRQLNQQQDRTQTDSRGNL